MSSVKNNFVWSPVNCWLDIQANLVLGQGVIEELSGAWQSKTSRFSIRWVKNTKHRTSILLSTIMKVTRQKNVTEIVPIPCNEATQGLDWRKVRFCVFVSACGLVDEASQGQNVHGRPLDAERAKRPGSGDSLDLRHVWKEGEAVIAWWSIDSTRCIFTVGARRLTHSQPIFTLNKVRLAEGAKLFPQLVVSLVRKEYIQLHPTEQAPG